MAIGGTLTSEEFGTFGFGLSPAEEARAETLQRESIIVDMLFQGPCGYRTFDALEAEGRSAPNGSTDLRVLPLDLALRGELPDFRSIWDESGITAVSFDTSFMPPEAGVEHIWGIGWVSRAFDTFDWLVKALRADDFRTAKRDGRRAAYLNAQFIDGIGRNLRLLDDAWREGMRMLQLTYNSMNFIGAGCLERTDAGVSHFGAQVIGRMNDLGLIVDLAHCGRQTTLDACEISAAPVVASHASARGLFDVLRGKTDEELEAIASTGGLIGVYMIPNFLGPGERVTIEAALDHIDYISRRVGWQHVGIGTDWPLGLPKATQRAIAPAMRASLGPGHTKEDDEMETLVGFDDYRDFPNITRGLVKRGYTDEKIRGILGENFLRVFETVCG